jgi:hypothetical protein
MNIQTSGNPDQKRQDNKEEHPEKVSENSAGDEPGAVEDEGAHFRFRINSE